MSNNNPPKHPAVTHILQFFAYKHLPENLQKIGKPFAILAIEMSDQLEGAELTVGLRKLLEAKDCMVRSAVSNP